MTEGAESFPPNDPRRFPRRTPRECYEDMVLADKLNEWIGSGAARAALKMAEDHLAKNRRRS